MRTIFTAQAAYSSDCGQRRFAANLAALGGVGLIDSFPAVSNVAATPQERLHVRNSRRDRRRLGGPGFCEGG